MEVKVGLFEVVGLQEMVKHANDIISPFASVDSFIYQVVNQ